MRALKLHKPGKLIFNNLSSMPEIKANEVLVNVKACGVCGSDIPRILTYGAYKANLIPGHEFSGVITELGSQVKQWKIGDRVCVAPLIPCFECDMCIKSYYSQCRSYDYLGSRTDGAMAEYVRVPERNLVFLPDKVSYEAGAMLDPAANAAHALKKIELNKIKSLAVLGLGAIGLFAIQMAKNAGVDFVVGVDINPQKLELGLIAGADAVVDSSNDLISSQLLDKSAGLGFDAILEACGNSLVQNEALLSAANKATIIFLGISHSQLNLSEKAVEAILRKELNIKGSWNSFSYPFPGSEWTQTIKDFEANKLWSPKFISHRLALEEGVDFFDKLQRNPSMFYSKVIFLP